MQLSTLKEVFTEMCTLVCMGSIISTILVISLLFGAEISVFWVFMPFLFSLSIMTTVMSLIGMWVGWHYLIYIFDKEIKNEP
mgnify:CR=1 FL=1